MGMKIKEAEGRVAVLQKDVKTQESEVNMLNSQLTCEQAHKIIAELQTKNESMKQKISKLKSGTVLVSKEDREKLFSRRDKMITHWKKRKRMASDMLGCILEGYPKTKKQLYE